MYLYRQLNSITIMEMEGLDETEDFLINVPYANPNKHKRLKNLNGRSSIVKLMRNKNREVLNQNSKGN